MLALLTIATTVTTVSYTLVLCCLNQYCYLSEKHVPLFTMVFVVTVKICFELFYGYSFLVFNNSKHVVMLLGQLFTDVLERYKNHFHS